MDGSDKDRFGGASEYMTGGAGCGCSGASGGVEGGGLLADAGYTTPYKIVSTLMLVAALFLLISMLPVGDDARLGLVVPAGILTLLYVAVEVAALASTKWGNGDVNTWLNKPLFGAAQA